MKLMNVLSLQRLSRDSTYPMCLEGQMNFRRSNDEKFQKRYFILKGNLLFYFAKKTDPRPQGLIILEGYTVELSNEHEGYCFQLVRRSNGQVAAAWTFVVATAEMLQKWLTALANCSYDQLKISAERIAELASTNNDQPKTDVPTDQNDNPLSNSAHKTAMYDSSKTKSFEELHEIYGQTIKEMSATSKT